MTFPSNRPPSTPSTRAGARPVASAAGSAHASTIGSRLVSAAIATATAVVIFGSALAFVFNPAFVGFEQERTHADYYTGWPIAEVHRITDAVVGQVLVGPGTFDMTTNGARVFDPAEAQHMIDVRRVMIWLEIGVAGAVALLVVAAFRMRDRRRLWSAVATGAKVLAIGIVVVGIGFAVAFELFHQLLFPAGSYAFDPTIEHLVQLFPEQLFSEATIVMALVGLGISIIVNRYAGRRTRALAAPNPAA